MQSNSNILPPLDLVISKIKKLEQLSPEEEIVYLINIEHLSEADARKVVLAKSDPEDNN